MSDAMRRARRHMLARTGLAWLIMMQAMMLAFPGYLRSGARAPESQIALEQAIFFMNWLSLILCVPLMLYCAWPVWRGVLRDLGRRRVGMDVPVALGIVAAFIPSVLATIRDSGEVYFESVAMFVAFLLTARYLETCARQALGQAGARGADSALLDYADRIAFWFVLVQISLACAVGMVWWYIAPQHAVAVTVALLVMSCPCALSMAVPAALAGRNAVCLRAGIQADTDAQLQHATLRIAKQNLFGSLAWHVLVTPLAAIGLVQPWVAAITMLVSSLAVAANSWRLSAQQSAARLQVQSVGG